MTDKQVQFDPAKLARLKKRYKQAVVNNEDQFTFEGDEYLTSYAKYLIEFLMLQFNKKR